MSTYFIKYLLLYRESIILQEKYFFCFGESVFIMLEYEKLPVSVQTILQLNLQKKIISNFYFFPCNSPLATVSEGKKFPSNKIGSLLVNV